MVFVLPTPFSEDTSHNFGIPVLWPKSVLFIFSPFSSFVHPSFPLGTFPSLLAASILNPPPLPQILRSLEEESDINAVTDYFSYEHFYVIYCKFWELDTDHDLVIGEQDLSRHADHGEWGRGRKEGIRQ